MKIDEIKRLDLSQIGKRWKIYDGQRIYNFEAHVKACEELDAAKKLPSSFMAISPTSGTDMVWDDINRMNTLNTNQALKKREKHVCPLQIDVTDRVILRYSTPGDKVKDWFAGLGTVVIRAMALGRIGEGTELNKSYWLDGKTYIRETEMKNGVRTLFDFLDLKPGDLLDKEEVA